MSRQNGQQRKTLESDRADVARVKAKMRQFGIIPKSDFSPLQKGKPWIMVYENPFAPASRRHCIGAFAGQTELYSTPFESELAARKEFERKAEAA